MNNGRNNQESTERGLFSHMAGYPAAPAYPPPHGSYSCPPQGGYYPPQTAYPPQGSYYPPQYPPNAAAGYPPSGYPHSGYHQPSYHAPHAYPSAYPSGKHDHPNLLSETNI